MAVIKSFFMQKFKYEKQGGKCLMNFTEEFLEKCFCNEEMRKIPCGAQSTILHALEDIFKGMLKENPYEQLSELFTEPDTESDDVSESV